MRIKFNLHNTPNYRLGVYSLSYDYDVDDDNGTIFFDSVNKIIKIPVDKIYDGTEYFEEYNKFYGIIQKFSDWEDKYIYGDVSVNNNVLILTYQIYDESQYTEYKDCKFDEKLVGKSLYLKPTIYGLYDRAPLTYIYNANLMHMKVSDSECLHADINKTTFSIADRVDLDSTNIKNTLVELIDYDLYEKPEWTNWISNTPLYDGEKVRFSTTDYIKFKNIYFEHYLRYGSGYIGVKNMYQNMIATRVFNVCSALRGVAEYERNSIYGIIKRYNFRYKSDSKELEYTSVYYTRYWFLDLRENKNPLRDVNDLSLYVQPGFLIGKEIVNTLSPTQYRNNFYYQNGNILTPWHSSINDYKTYRFVNTIIGIDESFEFFEPINIPYQGQSQISTSLDKINNAIDKFGNLISTATNVGLASITGNPFAATRAVSGSINTIKGFANWYTDVRDKLGKNNVPIQDNKIYLMEINKCNYYTKGLNLTDFKPKYIQNINAEIGFKSPLLEVIYD